MTTKIALFFTTVADRDNAYAAIKAKFVGADHGVSGGVAVNGVTPAPQIWATADIDTTAVATTLKSFTCTQAKDGKVQAVDAAPAVGGAKKGTP